MITAQFSNILKLFLPSWNFFNDFSAAPRLDARIIHEGQEHEWQPLYAENSTRSLTRIIFNSHGNLELLEKTFIDRAVDVFDEANPHFGKQFEQCPHHQTLIRIVRSRLVTTQHNDEFQFRLVMTIPGEPEEILFVSTRHPVAEESQ